MVRDPILNLTESQIPYVKICVAVDRVFRNNKDEKVADFIDVVFFRKNAELICEYLDKGSLVLIQGKLKTSSYQNKEGDKRYSLDIIGEKINFLETKSQAAARRKVNVLENS